VWSAGTGCESVVEAIHTNAENDEENERRGDGEDDEKHERTTPPRNDVRPTYKPDYGVGSFLKMLTYLL